MHVSLPVRIAACGLLLASVVSALLPPPAGVVRISQAFAASTPVASPGMEEAIEIVGLVERSGPFPLAELRRLPHEQVEVTYETSAGLEQHQFTGVRLVDVLQQVGIIADPGDRTPLLRRYLIITATDGYRVVVSGGELDPDFGNTPMLLAWEQDGQPLTGEERPLALVVPGDRLASRYVYGVVQIEVLGIESAPEVGE